MGCYPCGVQSYELFFNITQKSVILFIHGGQSSDHRNLDGIYTDGLGLPVGKKSLEEIFVEMLLTQEMKFPRNIIFN